MCYVFLSSAGALEVGTVAAVAVMQSGISVLESDSCLQFRSGHSHLGDCFCVPEDPANAGSHWHYDGTKYCRPSWTKHFLSMSGVLQRKTVVPRSSSTHEEFVMGRDDLRNCWCDRRLSKSMIANVSEV